MGYLKLLFLVGLFAAHGAPSRSPHHASPVKAEAHLGQSHARKAAPADVGRSGVRYAGPDVPMLSRDERAAQHRGDAWTQDRALT